MSIVGLAACGFPRLPGLEARDAAPIDSSTSSSADACSTGTCECTVATQDRDCGAYQVCDESGAGRACVCAPAYADRGAGCVFDVAPRDPGFMDPTAWTTTGVGARINAAGAGTIDPGLAEITTEGMCAGSSVSQTFVMPPLAKAQPFAVSVTYGQVTTSANLGGFAALLSLEIGGRFFDSPASNTPTTQRFCLGEKDYGRPVDIRIATRGGPTVCPTPQPGALDVDQLVIQPVTTDECPMPGTITNGDFEGVNGWAFSVREGATAAIVGGVGESSSRAAQLATTTRCSETSMTGMLAVPEQIANPAIDVFYSEAYTGSDGGRLTVSFDGKNISVLLSNVTPGHAHVCLPRWALGTTGSLGLLLQQDAAGGPGTCETPLVRTWTIDNVKLISDATCGATVDNLDGGFERIVNRNGPTPGWGLIDGTVNDIKAATATIVHTGTEAHTGNGVLRLAAVNNCSRAGADLSFLVPQPQGAAGPALKLFANVGANPSSDTVVTVSPEVRFTLPEQGVYAQHVVCLPPRQIGHLVTARIDTHGLGGSCTDAFDEHALIDDVQISTDPSCPAQ